MPERDRIKSDLVDFYDAFAGERSEAALVPDRSVARGVLIDAMVSTGLGWMVDFAAGTGQDAEEFRANGLEVIAVDLSYAHCRYCRKRGCEAVRADLYTLPFADRSIRAGWCASAYMHVPADDTPAVMLEAHRVMADDAPFVVGVWTGEADEVERVRDEHRRFYSVRPPDWWLDQFRAAGFAASDTWQDADAGTGDGSYLWCVLRC